MSEEWEMLDVQECRTDLAKIIKAWNYYNTEYANSDIYDFLNNRIWGFTEERFKHVVSGSSDYRYIHVHDIDFEEERLLRITWIGPALRAENCQLELRKESRPDSRGRKRINRLYLVIDKNYVVVLEEDGDRHRFRTAYPASRNSIERKRKKSVLIHSVCT
jgi:hypothetical protein